MKLTRMYEDSFSWTRWRRFDLYDRLNIPCRELFIEAKRRRIKQHAVGWIEADKLRCRPKPRCKAVMFLAGGEFSWVHMTDAEFEIVFKGETEE